MSGKGDGAVPPSKVPKKASRFNVLSIHKQWLLHVYKANGLKSQQIQVDEFSSMHCWLPRVANTNNRTPLLLLHGFGTGALVQWNYQLKDWGKRFDLYIPDLIFFGGSTSTNPDFCEDYQADCCLKMMSLLGVERFDLVGFSYGGGISYRMCHLSPHRVGRLVLMGSAILAGREEFGEMLQRMGATESSHMQPTDIEGVRQMLRVAYRRPPRLPPCILKQVLEGMFGEDDPEKKRILVRGFRKRMENFDINEVPKIIQEVLIIGGEFDPLMPSAVNERLAQFLDGHARVVEIKDTAHMMHAEKPKEVNKLVLDFLTAI